jgi:uncharacterized protein
MLRLYNYWFTSGIFLSAIIAFAGLSKVSQSIREIYELPPPSALSQPVQLAPMTVNPSWIKSGTPHFRSAIYTSSLDGKESTGVWECDGPTTFEWHFGHDETVYILEGTVEIEYLRNKIILNPGDSAVFHAGTEAVWHIPEHLKKIFVLHEPGIPVKVYRKLMSYLQTYSG